MIEQILSRFERIINPFGDPQRINPLTPPTSLKVLLLSVAREFRGTLVASMVFATLFSLTEALILWMMGWIVDALASTPYDLFFSVHLDMLLIFFVLTLIVRPLVGGIHQLLKNQVLVPSTGTLVRWRFHEYVSNHSIAFFQNDFAGRIAGKVAQAGSAFRNALAIIVDQLWNGAVHIAATAALLLSVSWQLVLPLGLWLYAYYVIARWFLPRSQSAANRTAEANSRLNGRLVDSYSNFITIELFSSKERDKIYIREALEDTQERIFYQSRLSTQITMLLWILNGILISSVTLVAILLCEQGHTTPGVVAGTIGVLTRIHILSQVVIFNLGNLFDSIGALENSVRSIARRHEVADCPEALPLISTDGAIRFENVFFGYSDTRRVIDGLSLSVAPGERVGIVGPSGAGKSTLAHLLLRLYDISEGRILIDEQDIRSVTKASLRDRIGLVTQDISLFHRSVRENISYGCINATEEEIVDAARRARAHDFILNLQDSEGRRGYDAHVGERGVKLSGGQRQRIAIARVILKDAQILVLDEATSSLDSEVEAAIQENLGGLMEGKTVIAIAHRLSTITRMDRLIVMNQGRIVEEGTHSALLERGGLYSRLWARQTNGYIGIE
ncbi:ABC transporter ATP-binding protein/permease [Inquilinus limosus]|uniref:ABC transporter ATP-binding protein n=1 Tax=Inquilinus limosus TaxID=171674 RepID=UPI003F14C76A